MTLTRNQGRIGHRAAKGFGLPSGAQAAVLAASISLAMGVQGAAAADVSPHALKAKMDYCEVCHGVSGSGFVGYFPVPRLAGQQVEYIENQLKGFVDRKRENKASPEKTNVMFNVGHVLTPAMITALAESFHKLDPKPVGAGPKDLDAAGQKIFEQGVPGASVPACASCHGDHGKGNGPIPRLAGQLYPYVVTQLTNWPKERGETNSNIMAPIAHKLTDSEVHAVAAYVSQLQ